MLAAKASDADFQPREDDRHQGTQSPVNALFGAAVRKVIELDDQGIKLRVDITDKPFEAMARAAEQLRSFGLSYALAESLVESLEEEFIHQAADFAKKKKPTPLTIQVEVTDRQPDVDPDNKTTKILAFDGMHKFGSDFSVIGRALTNTGEKMTETNMPDFADIFKMGIRKILIFRFEKDAHSTLNGVNTATIAASVIEAAGPGADMAQAQELAEAIEAGEASPELIELVQTMAELNALKTEAAQPGAPAELQAMIEVLQASVDAQIGAMESLPPLLQQAAIEMVSDPSLMTEMSVPAVADLAADAVVELTADAADAALEAGADITAEGEAALENAENVVALDSTAAPEAFEADMPEMPETAQRGEPGETQPLENPAIAEATAEAGQDGTQITPEMLEMVSDAVMTLSGAEKAELQALIDKADLAEPVRERMIDAVEHGEFTVADFKVVEARVEPLTQNTQTAAAQIEAQALSQKLESLVHAADMSLIQFAQTVERADPPVALPPNMIETAMAAISNAPEIPLKEKAALVQTLREPIPARDMPQIIAAVAKVDERVGAAMERTQMRQAVQAHARQIAQDVPAPAKANPVVANVVRTLGQGQVPPRKDMDAIRRDLPPVIREQLRVLSHLETRKLTDDTKTQPVKQELQRVIEVLRQPGFDRKSDMSAKVVEQFLDKHPNPTINDVTKLVGSLPEGKVRDDLMKGLEEVQKQQPYVVTPRADNPAPAIAALDNIAQAMPPHLRADIKEITTTLSLNEPVAADKINDLFAKLPANDQAVLADLLQYTKEEPVVAKRCPGCPGGDCASCNKNFTERGQAFLNKLMGEDAPKKDGQSDIAANIRKVFGRTANENSVSGATPAAQPARVPQFMRKILG